MNQDKLQRALQDYRRLKTISELSSEDHVRVREQPQLVSRFYDAVTSFFEFGWGTTFHFSPRRPRENLVKSQLRHDAEIGQLLRLNSDMVVGDIGCGVGGPLITIAQTTGAKIVGINFNRRQIQRGEERVRRAGLKDTCSFLYTDYMKIPLDDSIFDALYSFEALCHAPDKRLALRELFRILKPNGEVAIVDWALTDKFDPDNHQHAAIRTQIENNNATPELPTTESYVDSARDAGFDVIVAKDQQTEEGNPATPWYMALEGRDFSLSSMARTPFGRAFTARATHLFEGLKVAPAGTSETARMLNAAADALVEAGRLGFFTPSFLIHARKPN